MVGRDNVSSSVPLPNFLGIGAQKGGTTWLHRMLSQHPDICLPKQKELFFFDVRRNYERLGRDGYRSYFDHFCGQSAVGEITPGYMWTASHYKDADFNRFRRGIPTRVRKMLGDEIKLIVFIRHPVWRAVSAYIHHLYRDRFNIDESILEVGTRYGIFDMGYYSLQLKPWFDEFSMRNFFVRTLDDVVSDRDRVLGEVTDFLKVEPFSPVEKEKRYMRTKEYMRDEEGGISIVDGKNRIPCITAEEIGVMHEMYADEIIAMKSLFSVSWLL